MIAYFATAPFSLFLSLYYLFFSDGFLVSAIQDLKVSSLMPNSCWT